MSTTAKVMNALSQVVLDGGGVVTLSGEGRRRILDMDTCDPAQVWTTSHCQDQASPELVVQNLTFADGNSTGQQFDGGGAAPGTPGGGSGRAIYNDGDRMSLSIGGSLFESNHATEGGGAIFFVSNDRSGTITIRHSTLERDHNCRFHGRLPGVFFLRAREPTVTDSVLR